MFFRLCVDVFTIVIPLKSMHINTHLNIFKSVKHWKSFPSTYSELWLFSKGNVSVCHAARCPWIALWVVNFQRWVLCPCKAVLRELSTRHWCWILSEISSYSTFTERQCHVKVNTPQRIHTRTFSGQARKSLPLCAYVNIAHKENYYQHFGI